MIFRPQSSQKSIKGLVGEATCWSPRINIFLYSPNEFVVFVKFWG